MGVPSKPKRNSAFSEGSGAGRTTRVVQAPEYDEPEEDADKYEDHEEEQTTAAPKPSTPVVTTTTTATPATSSGKTKKETPEEKKARLDAIEAKRTEKEENWITDQLKDEPEKLKFFQSRVGHSCKSCGETIKGITDSVVNHSIEDNGLCQNANEALSTWSKKSPIVYKTLGLPSYPEDNSYDHPAEKIHLENPETWTPEMKAAHKAHYQEFSPHFSDVDQDFGIEHGFAPKDINNWSAGKFNGNLDKEDILGGYNGPKTEKERTYSVNRVGKPCSFCGEQINSLNDVEDHHIQSNGWCRTAVQAISATDND
jgi:hypothetical protein